MPPSPPIPPAPPAPPGQCVDISYTPTIVQRYRMRIKLMGLVLGGGSVAGSLADFLDQLVPDIIESILVYGYMPCNKVWCMLSTSVAVKAAAAVTTCASMRCHAHLSGRSESAGTEVAAESSPVASVRFGWNALHALRMCYEGNAGHAVCPMHADSVDGGCERHEDVPCRATSHHRDDAHADHQ